MLRIYNKKHKLNYKEKNLIKQIGPLLEKRMESDPDFARKFTPASDWTELERLYQNLSSDPAEYEEIQDAADEPEPYEQKATNQDKTMENTEKETKWTDADFADPLNRQEPLVRDYVLNDSFDKGKTEKPTATDFAEPIDFTDAFEIPDSDSPSKNGQKSGGTGAKSNFSNMGGKGSLGGDKSPKSTPMNPDFDNIRDDQKKKKAKRFAKYLVEAVASLSKLGFVWWTTRRINPMKLAEYEINGDIDLTLLVTLDDAQQVTIKQFFQGLCIQAEQIAEFTKEEKDLLVEAATDYLLEKGVALTAGQDFGLALLTVIGTRVAQGVALNKSVDSLLSQLKTNKEGDETVAEEPAAKPKPPAKESPTARQEEDEIVYTKNPKPAASDEVITIDTLLGEEKTIE